MKTTLPVIIAFLSGIVMVISFFFGGPVGNVKEVVLQWVTIVGGFALVLGIYSIIRVNSKVVVRRGKDWIYKLATVISVFAMAIPAMLPATRESFGGKLFYSIFPDSWMPLMGNGPNSIYDWLFNYVDSPMMETMFATLAFYIASAAYRAFRARNIESTLLLITASIVMLWRIPMGEAFLRLFSDNLPEYINTYIMNGFNLSVQRGIIIGAALGAASMSLRVVLGIERTYMGKN
ncbi:MAG: hypothetical protein ABIJ45_13470 [Candidatus Zixiibacteriota bacterium]